MPLSQCSRGHHGTNTYCAVPRSYRNLNVPLSDRDPGSGGAGVLAVRVRVPGRRQRRRRVVSLSQKRRKIVANAGAATAGCGAGREQGPSLLADLLCPTRQGFAVLRCWLRGPVAGAGPWPPAAPRKHQIARRPAMPWLCRARQPPPGFNLNFSRALGAHSPGAVGGPPAWPNPAMTWPRRAWELLASSDCPATAPTLSPGRRGDILRVAFPVRNGGRHASLRRSPEKQSPWP